MSFGINMNKFCVFKSVILMTVLVKVSIFINYTFFWATIVYVSILDRVCLSVNMFSELFWILIQLHSSFWNLKLLTQ